MCHIVISFCPFLIAYCPKPPKMCDEAVDDYV